MIRLSFFRTVLLAALSASASSAALGASDEKRPLDDTAYMLSQSEVNTDTDSMSGLLSSIGTFALSDAQAETGTGVKSEIGLANKVVAQLELEQQDKKSK